jgi:hypothetical protein
MLFTSKNPSTEREYRINIEHDVLTSLVGIVIKTLEPWMLPGDETLRRLTLEKVIRSAIDLDSHMNEQWAIYLAIWIPILSDRQPRHGFEFDPNLLVNQRRDVPPDEGGIVQLRIAPALSRWGTAHGENYEKYNVLQKGRVLATTKKDQQKAVLQRSGGQVTQSISYSKVKREWFNTH